MLVRCPFGLAVEHDDIRGDIYMANKSEKIFVAVPVDDMIKMSQLRSMSIESGNL